MIPFYGAKKQCYEKEVWGHFSPLCLCFAEIYANSFCALPSCAVFAGKAAGVLPLDVWHRHVPGLGRYVQHWPVLKGSED